MKKNGNGSRARNLLLDLLIVILLIIIAVSGYKFGSAMWRYHVGTREAEKTAQLAEVPSTDSGEEEFTINWKKLKKKNSDVRAWLRQKGTVINYPVMQGEDNQFYLYRMFNKEYNVKGSLFIDFRNKKPFRGDFLTVIYGHRMRDKSMFWHIADYREKSYYKKHPTMRLYTPDGNYTLKIFAACTIPATSDKYAFDFEGRKSEREYLDWISENTQLKTNVEVTPEDRIVMLSTCTYEYKNARAVVYAKLVPDK